jgi:hypothetical protein
MKPDLIRDKLLAVIQTLYRKEGRHVSSYKVLYLFARVLNIELKGLSRQGLIRLKDAMKEREKKKKKKGLFLKRTLEIYYDELKRKQENLFVNESFDDMLFDLMNDPLEEQEHMWGID